MIQSTTQLPREYAPALVLDYDHNPKLSRRLLIAAILIFIGLFLAGNFYLPIYLLAYDEQGLPLSLQGIGLKLGVLVLMFIFYTVAHEKLRGVLMKRFSGAESGLEFKGAAAYAKSPGYFSKRDFRIICLGPVLILALLLFLGTMLLPMDWFWVGFIGQILNLAGSLKDFYSAWQGARQPADVLIQDDGLAQTFFTPSLEAVSRRDNPRKKPELSGSTQKQMKNIYQKKKKK